MSRAQTIYHRDFLFAETYEKLSLALETERTAQKPGVLRVRDLRSLGNGRFRLDVAQDDLLKVSPQEGWGFQAGEGIHGRVGRVELQHSYLTVRCERDLSALGVRQIWLQPHDFLANLRLWVNRQSGPIPLLPSASSRTPLSAPFPLRAKQREAIESFGPGRCFIWGPPGTGKTYTVGRLVVALRDQGYRVLLLAPTNVAVDLAILSADDAFAELGRSLRPGELLRAGRPELERLEARGHLMAWQQRQSELQNEITRLRQRRSRLKRALDLEPRPSQQRILDPDLEACELELREAERKRYTQQWNLVSQASILGCTVHASFGKREVADFCEGTKLAVVYDEAGMVGRFALAPMLALVRGEDAPCGRLEKVPDEVAFAFAGDPRQLSPIAHPPAQDLNARRWLSESLMECLPEDAVMLDEQSRMDEQICQLVSKCYYGGRLRTVPDERRLPIPLADGWPSEGVFLVDPQRSIYLPLEARERLSDLGKTDTFNEISVRIGALLIRWGLDAGRLRNVLWLTPFRQQTQRLQQATRLLFDSLETDSVVRAGTVHSAQGGEADLVVFDPVKPGHPWLKDTALADRLLNVAVSRGRTQVIVLASRNQLRRSCFWSALEDCKEYRLEGTPESPRLR